MRHTQRRSTKRLLALLSVSMGIVITVPAHAEPGMDEPPAGDDGAFLSSLRQLGISFNDPNQAIGAGQAVCGLIARGESGLELLDDLRTANPALTMNGAAQFATLAAKSYCPRQLEPNDHGIR
jgi:hypothetical protein